MTETSIKVFFSYSHKDEALRDSLATHLSNLEWQKVITSWHDRKIVAGTTWDSEIRFQLDSADIILLLISPDFIASSYCREVEIPQAMQRHETREAYIIPVILRPFYWLDAPFAKLQAYPQNAKPVTSWVNQDEAFVSVTQGIRTAAKLLHDYRIQQAQQQQKETVKARYLQKVEGVLLDGNITIAKRDILNDFRDELGLSPEEAEQIEAHWYEPYKRYEENLNKYKQTLTKYIEGGYYPFNENTQNDLEVRQRDLGLKSKDVERIKKPILEEAEVKYQEKLEAKRVKERLRQEEPKPGKLNIKKVWEFINKWNYFLLVIPAGIGFLFLIPQCSNSLRLSFSENSPTPSPEATVVSTPPVEPLTSDDIENLQEQISVGENVLAISEKNDANYPDAFQAAKEKGKNAIIGGNYQAAIDALTLTRQSSAREFYKNAPETLINLNNAYIGDKLAYTIAVAAPISQSDNYGLGVLRGVALAQQKINEEGGIEYANGNKMPLRVVLVDDQNTSNVKLARFLSGLSLNVSNINKDLKILGLIGHQTSDLTLELGKIYQEAKLPVISPSATSTELFGKFSYVHLVAPSTRQMAKSLNQKIDKQRVIVFYDSEEEFSKSFGTEVCKAVVVTCKPWNFNETPVVNTERVKKAIADGSTALVIAFNANKSEDNKNRASNIIKAVSEFNANSQNKMELFAANAFSDQTLINKARTGKVSIVRVGPWEPNLSGNLSFDIIKKNDQFLALNLELFGTRQVNWFTLMAYNATMALTEAIKKSQSPPPKNDDELKAMREKINAVFISGAFSVPGALGEIHFGKEGYVERGNVICLSRVGANTNSLTDCQPSESFPIK
ncbi:MAG: TIR domain-containing protein [Nostoc sp.]|uniref:TIR domain-containing protein n=1 Tax=Nostoc sp. TaxID=1180 RepID=UPI002FF886CB